MKNTILIIFVFVFGFALAWWIFDNDESKEIAVKEAPLAQSEQENPGAKAPIEASRELGASEEPEDGGDKQISQDADAGESAESFKLQNPGTFGIIVDTIHNNLDKGVDEAVEILNMGIDDAVYVSARVGDEVVKYNVQKYKIDEKTKELWLKIKENDKTERWIRVIGAGHEKLLRFLEKTLD